MKLGTKQELFTSNVAKLIQYAESVGLKCRMREVQRTAEQQNIYLQSGATKTKNSKHINSLAVDMYFASDGKIILNKADLQHIGDYWESLDSKNSWGGNWKKFQDCPHFERS